MLLKDFCINNGFEDEYYILKDKTNEYLKLFRMKKSYFNKIEVENFNEHLYGSADYLNDRICLGKNYLIKNLKERNINEILSTAVHEITHFETFRKSKYIRYKYYLDSEVKEFDVDYLFDIPPEYSFRHTRKFLFDNVVSYSYDYEFGTFNNVIDLSYLTKKQFDQLSLCVLKDFLEDPELSSIETFLESMDETISFGFDSIIHGVSNKKEYFDKYVFENKKMFLSYSIEECCCKSYLLDALNLNNQIIEEIFDTYNHSRVVKNSEKIIMSDDIKEIVGKSTLRRLEKV